MDSFTLRQEISDLSKQYNDLKHKLDIGEARIKELHEEEMLYLKEIPIYKEQANLSKIKAEEASGKISPLQKIIDDTQNELIRIQDSTAKENQALRELKETQLKIIAETKKINEDIKVSHEKLKQRELAVGDREKSCELIEVGHVNRDNDLDKREIDLENKGKKLNDEHIKLNDLIECHHNNVLEHNKKVDIFIQTKELHLQDEKMLSVRQEKLNKLVTDNAKLKADLLIQLDNLSKELSVTKRKQDFLDRSIADLSNQQNALKLKELKIMKMAHDAGIQKELKELEEFKTETTTEVKP